MPVSVRRHLIMPVRGGPSGRSPGPMPDLRPSPDSALPSERGPIEALELDRSFVRLRDYNSWWQRESDVNALMVSRGLQLLRARRAALGYLNTYRLAPAAGSS